MAASNATAPVRLVSEGIGQYVDHDDVRDETEIRLSADRQPSVTVVEKVECRSSGERSERDP